MTMWEYLNNKTIYYEDEQFEIKFNGIPLLYNNGYEVCATHSKEVILFIIKNDILNINLLNELIRIYPEYLI